ncbi:unnamed protein product [Calypogeia fissa]
MQYEVPVHYVNDSFINGYDRAFKKGGEVNVKVKAEHGVPGGLEVEEKAEQSVVNTTVNPISSKEARRVTRERRARERKDARDEALMNHWLAEENQKREWEEENKDSENEADHKYQPLDFVWVDFE